MMFDSVDDLITQIDAWLGFRGELQTQYPSFVMLAEQRMYRRLRCREMMARTVSLLTEQYEWLPFNFLAVRSVFCNPGNQTNAYQVQGVRLTGMTEGQLDNQYGLQTAVMPEAYAIVGNQIKFGPAPSPNSPPLPEDVVDPTPYRNFELSYFMRFPRLVPASVRPDSPNESNQILMIYPELYLYGALIEAEPYLVDDQRIMVWKQLYEEAITDINNASREGAVSALTTGPAS